MEGAARAGRQPGPPGGGQLRQRLLRRHPRHRRRPGRSDAAGRVRGRRARCREAGRLPGLRRRRRGRAGARGRDRLVAGRRGGGVRAGRLVLHRRREALRLPRARRGDGVRLLRPGRGDRYDVRPDRDLGVAGAVRRRRHRRTGLRDPGRQQPARHPHRRGGRQAHPRGPARRAADPWPLRPARAGRGGGRGGGRGLDHVVRAGRAGLPAPRRTRAARPCSAAPAARRWCRCCSRPASPSWPGRCSSPRRSSPAARSRGRGER